MQPPYGYDVMHLCMETLLSYIIFTQQFLQYEGSINYSGLKGPIFNVCLCERMAIHNKSCLRFRILNKHNVPCI